MDEELKLLLGAAKVVLVVLIVSVSGCCIHNDYRISKAIDKGIDPVLARIAFENGGGDYQRMVYISKFKEQSK